VQLKFEYLKEVEADLIESLKAGTIIIIKGRSYMRLEDNPYRHFEGMVVDLKNGLHCHWSRLVYAQEMVEITTNPFYS
jgi:hypothetical protein